MEPNAEHPLELLYRDTIQAWVLQARQGYGVRFAQGSEAISAALQQSGYLGEVEIVGSRNEVHGQTYYVRFLAGAPQPHVVDAFLKGAAQAGYVWKMTPLTTELLQQLSHGTLYLVHYAGEAGYYTLKVAAELLAESGRMAALGEVVLEVTSSQLISRRLTDAERQALTALRGQRIVAVV